MTTPLFSFSYSHFFSLFSPKKPRYPNAIVDSRASLAYKKQYLSEDSEIIAEAHFKLSLALEFASVTTAHDENGNGNSNGSGAEGQQVDQTLRDEAASELEAAIASTKLKLQTKEVELATLHSPEDNDATRRQITEVKDIIADMEQRVRPAFFILLFFSTRFPFPPIFSIFSRLFGSPPFPVPLLLLFLIRAYARSIAWILVASYHPSVCHVPSLASGPFICTPPPACPRQVG